MDEMTEVGHDIDRMLRVLDRAQAGLAEQGERGVRAPCVPTGDFRELNPGRARLDAVNLCFTEWVLFERPAPGPHAASGCMWIMPPTGWIPPR